MTPSSSSASSLRPRRRRTRRRCHNAAAGLVGATATATARALAAGLWRMRHAERQAAVSHHHHHGCPHSPRSYRRKAAKLCNFGAGLRCRNHCILDKIDACVVEMELPASYDAAASSSSMEKATKWDRLHNDPRRLPPHARRHATAALMADELAKARALIGELEHEKRSTRKKLERFLKRVAEEKASRKRRAAALEAELAAERRHRRALEAANARLVVVGKKELPEPEKKKWKRRYEAERAARETMERAWSELGKEAEEDRAEVELLRRELVALRAEMEEERRMLQMAELWREERVQMKLADARLALDHKYAHISRLQADMEAFLRRRGSGSSASAARLLGEAAAGSVRHEFGCRSQRPSDREDEDRALFQHFRRREETAAAAGNGGGSPAARSNVHSVSPATDIFLEKLEPDGERRRRGSSDSAGTSSSSGSDSRPSEVGARGSPLLSDGEAGRHRHLHLPADASSSAPVTGNGNGKKNTALIQRIWRSAISDSRKLKSSSDHKDKAAAAATLPPVAAPEQCAASSSAAMSSPCSYSHPHPQQSARSEHQKQKLKQISLQEKLMEARIDDQKEMKHNY